MHFFLLLVGDIRDEGNGWIELFVLTLPGKLPLAMHPFKLFPRRPGDTLCSSYVTTITSPAKVCLTQVGNRVFHFFGTKRFSSKLRKPLCMYQRILVLTAHNFDFAH